MRNIKMRPPSEFALGEAVEASDYDLVPLYNASLTSSLSSSAPGSQAVGDYCLKVTSFPDMKSGVTQKNNLPVLEPGKSYDIRLRIHCPGQKIFFVGIENDSTGIQWAIDPTTGADRFFNKPDEWTTFNCVLTVPPGGALSKIYIINWIQGVHWYLDDLSVTEQE